MNLDLILTDEQISLIICEAPIASVQLLKCVEHGSVERILVSSGDDASEHWRQSTATHLVANHDQKPVEPTVSNQNMILSAPD
jgi:hypothetical protein